MDLFYYIYMFCIYITIVGYSIYFFLCLLYILCMYFQLTEQDTTTPNKRPHAKHAQTYVFVCMCLYKNKID